MSGNREDGTANEVAVALDYDMARDGAPRVMAKGHGDVARRIIDLAKANGIHVRRDADLAQVLSALDIGTEIPVEAFAAVAEILSYVYDANRRRAETSREDSALGDDR